ncbi:MAG: hypothetical protein C0624_13930 [Desulfuromonas sp.]|nr:MAG: hypothetical protein C0624_13930 [Desulfuromonas sp.]
MQRRSGENNLKMLGLKSLYADERGDAKRIVLIVVLVLVLVAAVVFLLFPDLISPPTSEPAKPVKSTIQRKVVKLPKKPAAKPAESKPAAKAGVEDKAVAAKPAAKKKAAEAKAVKTKAAAVAAEKKAAVKPKQAPKPAAKPAAKPAPPTPAVSAPEGPYTVTAGAYLMSSSVTEADKSVKQLGYTPYHSTVKRDIEVTRLKEGTYSEAEARARVVQYQREFTKEAFVMKEAAGWTVYLGSYVGLDRARVYADQLYAQGLRLTEVKAVVPMSLTLVRFGDFPDQSAAEKAVAKAKAAGLDAYVSKVK